MVKTRAQKEMDRASLDEMTLEQLREEVQRLGITVTDERAGQRSGLINAIMSAWERQSTEIRIEQVTRSPLVQIQTAEPLPVPSTSHQSNMDALFLQMLTSMNNMMKQQQEANRQQQQLLLQNQQQLQQLVQGVIRYPGNSVARIGVPTAQVATGTLQDTAPTAAASPSGSGQSERSEARSGTSGLPPGNVVSWLASQIPEFAGSQDDNVMT